MAPEGDINGTALPHGSVQSFPEGTDPVALALNDFRFVEPAAVERWFVQDEPVYAHIRDPYHRVDVLSSYRHPRVEYAGTRRR